MAKAPNSVYIPLETISEGGGVPASRLSDPMAAQVIVQRLIEANQGRSKTDGEVYGLISGNPPFSQVKLIEQAESWRANFPTRIGEATFNRAKSRFEDIILKSRPLANVVTAHGDDVNERAEWS